MKTLIILTVILVMMGCSWDFQVRDNLNIARKHGIEAESRETNDLKIKEGSAAVPAPDIMYGNARGSNGGSPRTWEGTEKWTLDEKPTVTKASPWRWLLPICVSVAVLIGGLAFLTWFSLWCAKKGRVYDFSEGPGK